MTFASLLALLPAVLGFAGVQSAADGARVQSMTVEHQIIMRIPVRPWRSPARIEWVEHKGPKCIPANTILGAALSGPDHVDLILADRQRIRAELNNDCPTLDFYGGFYLEREDERICAKRDSIHSRVGGNCEIRRFRRLEARIKPPNS
jgi:hypothetical protein